MRSPQIWPSANWRPKKPVCSRSLSLKAGQPGAPVVYILVQGPERADSPAQQSGKGRSLSYSAFLCYSGPPTIGWAICSIHSMIQILISSGNTLTDLPKIMFNQIPGHTVALSSWHIKWTFTMRDIKDGFRISLWKYTAVTTWFKRRASLWAPFAEQALSLLCLWYSAEDDIRKEL